MPENCPSCGVLITGVTGGEPPGYSVSYTWFPCLHTHRYGPGMKPEDWKLIPLPWYRSEPDVGTPLLTQPLEVEVTVRIKP